MGYGSPVDRSPFYISLRYFASSRILRLVLRAYRSILDRIPILSDVVIPILLNKN